MESGVNYHSCIFKLNLSVITRGSPGKHKWNSSKVSDSSTAGCVIFSVIVSCEWSAVWKTIPPLSARRLREPAGRVEPTSISNMLPLHLRLWDTTAGTLTWLWSTGRNLCAARGPSSPYSFSTRMSLDQVTVNFYCRPAYQATFCSPAAPPRRCYHPCLLTRGRLKDKEPCLGNERNEPHGVKREKMNTNLRGK